MMTLTNQRSSLFPELIQRISNQEKRIQHWLNRYAESQELPLYSSVDIRDAGFKTAVVDTNLYPAGFNNLCEHGIEDATAFFRKAILARVPECRNILIIAEEHTRNTWYLENIRVLSDIISRSSFQSKVATFLTVEPEFCRDAASIELTTATGQTVKVHCLQKLIKGVAESTEQFDLIILNNDLTTGIPQILKDAEIPIYPSVMAGWHSRMKSHHFSHAADLIKEFAKIIDLDPWFFSCLYTVVDRVDIHDPQDRGRLRDAASGLFRRVADKYAEHRIDEKPYLVIKSDSGTYGMGVLAVGGTLTIETADVQLDEEYTSLFTELSAGPYVCLAVSDTGMGMESETISRVFDPFFTTKDKGVGTGLGLSTVFGIVKQHQGNVTVYSEPGRGTTFKVYLPRSEGVPEQTRMTRLLQPEAIGTETIMIVEDEEIVRNLALEALEMMGYSLLAAPDPEQAIAHCQDYSGPIHLLLTDVVLPQMDGKSLYDKVKATRPEMRVLYVSGYTENFIVHHGVLDKDVNFLQKPFTVDGLANKVREVLDG